MKERRISPPATYNNQPLKTKNPGRDHKVKKERCWGMKMGSRKEKKKNLPSVSWDDLWAALLLHTFIFSSSRQMCEQCPRLPHSCSSLPSVHSLRSIDHTDPSLVMHYVLCRFQSQLISLGDQRAQPDRVTHSQEGRKERRTEVVDGGKGEGDISEVITGTELAGVCAH